VASGFGVESYDRVEAVVSRTDIAAVIISSPPAFHLEAIRMAAAAGKHIFCEKPLTLTLEDADAAIEMVRKAGTLLQVGHMRRYDPAYAEAKKRIDAGEIGRVVIFKGIGRDLESPPSTPAQTGINGTLFHDSSSHDFDMARWLTGDEIVEVFSYGGTLVMPDMERFGAMDSGVVNFRFRGGAVGNVESFLHARYGYDVRTEVVGTKGTLQIGTHQQTPLVVLSGSRRNQDVVTHWLNRFAEAYRLEMTDFIRSVREGGPPRVSGVDGRQSVAVAVAALKSHREHRPVQVSLGS
jgi:predicted dehydrogenase